MSALPCRVTGDLARYQRDQDADSLRGERIDAWRNQRRSQLECGNDADALLEAIPEGEEGESLLAYVTAALMPDQDLRLLKIEEITQRIIEDALDFEEQRGDWDE